MSAIPMLEPLSPILSRSIARQGLALQIVHIHVGLPVPELVLRYLFSLSILLQFLAFVRLYKVVFLHNSPKVSQHVLVRLLAQGSGLFP